MPHGAVARFGFRLPAAAIDVGPRSSQFRPILAVCIYTGTRRFDERFLGMSVPDKVSYFSRFTMKFLEICAASIATAVGGYLVAHLGGYLPWPGREPAPTPAAIQSATSPSGVVSKTPRAQPPQPVPPASADADEPRPAAAPDAGSAAKRPARTTVNATQAAPSHRPMTTGTIAPESKPHEVESPESKPRDAESVAAQVRAALEKVDAHRPAPSDAAPQTVSLPPAPPAATVEPRPAEGPVLGTTGAVAVAPPATAAVVVPPPAAEAAREPVQQAPVQPEPLTPVEIKSRPVAAVEASPSPQPAPPAHEEDKGFLSTLAKIPEMLRPAAGATGKDPPRPPLPVGE